MSEKTRPVDTALIVSNSGDIHCDFLMDACNRLGVACFRLNTDRFRRSGTLSWQLDSSNVRLSIDGRSCHLQQVGVLVYRRPVPAHQLRRDTEPWIGRLLDTEWNAVEAALSYSARCHLLNGLAGSALAQNKIIQLHAARQCALDVPETLISTDILELRAFVSHQRCVTKGIVNAFHIDKHSLRSGFTSFVDPAALTDYDPTGCPTLLQKAIDPFAVWRLVVVSGTVFGFRFAGAPLATEADARKVERLLDGEFIPAPEPISAKLIAMCKLLGIEFASADFVEDQAGRLWFLDLNPEGQWAYLEDRFGTRISDAIISLAKTSSDA